MDIKRINIKEGINLTVITDKKFKTDITSVAFLCGYGAEAAVCSALLTGVLSRCCIKYPSLMELNRTLDGLYDAQLVSDASRRGFNHVPTFTVSSLNNRYSLDKTDIRGGCLDVLYNIIFEPGLKNGYFDNKILQSEKLQLKDAINGIRNSRSSYAIRRCTEALMADQPLYAPRLGRTEDIDGVTPAVLTGFYRDMLKNSSVEILSVSSDDDGRITEFAARLSDMLGERKPGAVLTQEYKMPGKRIKRVSEQAGISQDVLCVGCEYDGSSEDYSRSAERTLFYEILFQNPTSYLFENVREKLSLCYYCSALPMIDLKKLIIYAGIDRKNAKRAEEEIKKQLDLIKRGVSEDDINRCRLALKNDLLAVADSPSRTAAWYARRAFYGGITETVQEFSAKLDTLKSEDVQRAASSAVPSLVFTMKGGADSEA